MLTLLAVRNVVLIKTLDLEFQSGLTVLTGETGAGKSILLDALGLALGSRANFGLIGAEAQQPKSPPYSPLTNSIPSGRFCTITALIAMVRLSCAAGYVMGNPRH